MKRIVLLRHGESLWNRENRFTGWTDVDLTPRGIEAALRACHGKAIVTSVNGNRETLEALLPLV